MEVPKLNPDQKLMAEKKIAERAKYEDDLPEETVKERANEFLNDMDLTIHDLKSKRVLDLASGPSFIAKAAKIAGIDTVTSLDIRQSVLSKTPDLDQIVANASTLPLKDETIDLLISRAGPPGIMSGFDSEKQKQFVLKMYNEICRVLTQNGEGRIFPPVFSFTFIQNERSRELLEKHNKNLSSEEKVELREIYKAAMILSTKFLTDNGFNISRHKRKENIKKDPGYDHLNYYWILKNEKN